MTQSCYDVHPFKLLQTRVPRTSWNHSKKRQREEDDGECYRRVTSRRKFSVTVPLDENASLSRGEEIRAEQARSCPGLPLYGKSLGVDVSFARSAPREGENQGPFEATSNPCCLEPKHPTPSVVAAEALRSKKLQSVLRGLTHVAECPAGCSRALCVSTRKLVKKIQVHEAQTRNQRHDWSRCAACKFWKTIVAAHAQSCVRSQCPIPMCWNHHDPDVSSSSKGSKPLSISELCS